MKKLYTLFFFCLAVAVSKAQIVNIPDANFKAKLLATTGPIGFNSSYNIVPIDANHDGQIQVSEAQLIYRLWVMSSNISDLTGIESFTNLRELNCNNNQLTSINLSALVNLKELDCSKNAISNLNLTNLNLQTLYCTNNSISNLDLHNLTALKYLYCNNNSISNLNVSGLSILNTFVCNNNQLTSLTLTGLTSLFNFDCSNNQLTVLDLAGLNSIYSINCAYNNLSKIDVSIFTVSRPWVQINCSYNTNLISINTKDNIIMSSEFSANYRMGNSGANAIPPPVVPPPTSGINFQGTPNLQYICADANEMAYYQNKINQSGYTNPNCQLSSTCEFLNPTSNTTTATVCGSYTWSVNGQTYSTSGTYTVVTGNHTEILNLTINNSLITTAPIAPVLCTTLGSMANISVASNIASPTYTWQYRVLTDAMPNSTWITITSSNAGSVYSNYTSAALSITRTTTALPKSGTQYRVIVGGGECASVTSDAVNLTIIGVAKSGSITAASSVCEANDITFTLGNYVGTSIQWQSAPNASSTFSDIPNATGTTFTVTNMQLTSYKSYRAIVTNAPCGTTATSTIKTITVNPTPVAGTITGGGTICSGGSGTLKIMGYIGKIQWEYSIDGITYFNAPTASSATSSLSFGTTSVSSTSAAYMLVNITGNTYFRAKVTSGACSPVYSDVVSYIIGTLASVGTTSAALTTICSGTATSVTITTATGTITWQKSINYTAASPTWTSIANSNALSISTGNLAYNTAFRAKVTLGSCSTVYSNTVYVYMVAKPLAKNISKNVTSPSGASSSTAMCTSNHSKVLTIGSGYNGTIQWQASTTSTTTGFADIGGATNESYTVNNPVVGANYLRAKFTNSCGASVFGVAATVYYQECLITKLDAALLFEVTASPNPYKNGFNLDLHSSNNEGVTIAVYDMTGKLIERTAIQPDAMADLTLGQGYSSGLYQVVVCQGTTTKTLKIIKE
ncbi:leucine-rich repeat domain-containing protein [Flavobacterium phycosphaerae]|uniref:leucine-rich repeat domain-containing protein n=1 Tax=Flavobacterium phycosphaerae TaxID=2697515 RepID=UPI00138A553B|nr:leucine-rich repeat domain-containing protein [Flavobacterium phycosphaerae]